MMEKILKVIKPKFKLGQKVHCFREDNKSIPFNFLGEITSIAEVNDTYEYEVTNAPEFYPGFNILIWECEIREI